MRLKLKLSVLLLLILSMFSACNNAKKEEQKFELHGSLKGITDGKLLLECFYDGKPIRDTAVIKEGKFVFKGDFPVPTVAYLFAPTRVYLRQYTAVYVENVKMNLTGTVRKKKYNPSVKFDDDPEYLISLEEVKITGGKAHEDYARYQEQKKAISFKYEDVIKEYHLKSTTIERKAELKKEIEKRNEEYKAFDEQYIKENPNSYYAAVLVSELSKGKSAVEIEKVLNSLDPRLQENHLLVSLRSKVAKMKEVEIGLDKIMIDASNVYYKVDEKFDGKDLKNVIYLGAFTNNNICALLKDGTIRIFNPSGKIVNSFKPELKGTPSSVAVDKSNNIYVLYRLQKEVTKKIRGKSYIQKVPWGVECTVFNKNGEQINHYSLPGSETATGARVSGDKLIVADYKNKRITMFDKKTGKAGATIKNMRSCCQILDISVNEKKEILVADLGAFRVQGFDFTGKKIIAFGQRGQSLDDFHGCCNPVSVANLSNGAVVTVEKDPTRIKVYSKEGAKKIAGIEELVKGCKHIPMIVDSKDNLYLASKEKGIVKCVSVN